MEKLYDILGKKFSQQELSAEESDFLSQWLLEDGNEQLMAEIQKTWDFAGKADFEMQVDTEAEWQRFESSNMQKSIALKPKKKGLTMWYAAASIALLLSVSIAYVFNGNWGMVEIASLDASKELVLPDGSQITLNAHSQIAYAKSFGKKNRDISLNGEAYFDVTKGSIPFIISAGETQTTVLGTSFNIRSYESEDAVELMVVSGKVQFEDKEQKHTIVLTKDQAASYSRNAKSITEQKSNTLLLGWKTGQLQIDGLSFAEIKPVLNRYFNAEFSYAPEIDSIRLTTQINDQDLEQFLQSLQIARGLNYEIEGNKVSLSLPQ